jgi:hypothetical protein
MERSVEVVESDASNTCHEEPRELKMPEPVPERKPENPVFASVREQFGKLRQQRASMERPSLKKTR